MAELHTDGRTFVKAYTFCMWFSHDVGKSKMSLLTFSPFPLLKYNHRIFTILFQIDVLLSFGKKIQFSKQPTYGTYSQRKMLVFYLIMLIKIRKLQRHCTKYQLCISHLLLHKNYYLTHTIISIVKRCYIGSFKPTQRLSSI